jgi:lysyl-tRNA synthetase class 2
MSDIPADITHDQHAVRRQKLADLRAGGTDPFRAEFQTTHFSGEALKAYVDGQDNAVGVSVAGRLVTIRDMGKSQFAKILDQQGEIQLYIKKDVVGDEAYRRLQEARPGRHHRRQGHPLQDEDRGGDGQGGRRPMCSFQRRSVPCPRSGTGLDRFRAGLPPALPRPGREPRVASSGSSCAPGSWLGDPQVPGGAQVHRGRDPVLQSVAGGAAAKPFHDPPQRARGGLLPADLARALPQADAGRRLDRVFEIGRNFRNEGISRRHNPEFTMLEVYQAYSDHRGMMVLIKEMLTTSAGRCWAPTRSSIAASGQDDRLWRAPGAR